MIALTRGGPSGHPRPIELHAHDPIRYVGDMLAWVHLAMASEREFLEALFFATTGDEEASRRRMVGSVWVREDDGRKDLAGNPIDAATWVIEIMNSDLDKLSTPLKVIALLACSALWDSLGGFTLLSTVFSKRSSPKKEA